VTSLRSPENMSPTTPVLKLISRSEGNGHPAIALWSVSQEATVATASRSFPLAPNRESIASMSPTTSPAGFRRR